MADVRVRFVAQDEATETARLLLETLRQLQKEERAAASATGEVARRSKEAADNFRGLARAIADIRGAGGVDAINRRIQILSEGLQIAATRAESLTRLTAIEGQLQRALQRTNLTLTDRIRLERTLQSTQAALGRGAVTTSLLGNLGQLQTGLLALGSAIAASRLLQLTSDAVDAADAMGELSQRTGVAVETLSVFTAEGGKAGVSVEGIELAFRQLARTIGELRSGNQEAIASFAALGLSAEDFAGKDLSSAFLLIADAQARFADGAGKTAAALRIFGRSGEEVIPLLNELADGGFDRARERAEELGIVLSTDTARAADDLNDSISDLGGAIRGFANELIASLGPLADVIRLVTEFLATIPDGLKAFIAGATLAGAAALALAGALGVLTIALGALASVTGVGVIAAIIGGLTLLGGLLASTVRGIQNLKREAQSLDADPNLNKALGGGKPDVPTIIDPAQARALRNAELAAQRDHARDVLALERALIQQRETLTEAAFARGETAITQFYAARLQAVRDGIEAERNALLAERNALRGAPLTEDTDAARVQRKAEIARIEAQIARLAVDGETRVLALLEQERQARQTLATQARALAVELLQAAGQEARASRIQIEEAARKAAETLRAVGGFTEDQINQIRTAFSTLLTDRAAFDRLNAQAQRDLAQLARERADIEEEARLGLISQERAQSRIAGLERNRLPALKQLVDVLRQFADRTNDPELKARVEELTASFRGMGTVVDELQLKVVNFGTALREGFQQSLSNFLGAGINQARNGLDALRLLALSIAETIQRITADIVSAQITRRLFGGGVSADLKEGAVAVTGSAAALAKSGQVLITAAASLTAAAAALSAAMLLRNIPTSGFIPGFATGGIVRGPGTGTSDSILARLSSGEFVVRAAVVQQPGMKQLLTALNAGLRTPRMRSLDAYGVPRFAEGGLVGTAGRATAPLAGKLEIDVSHSEDTIVRLLKTPDFANAVVRTVQKNRDLFRSVLG